MSRSVTVVNHGYYGHYCYLPLYVFCGQDMLACVLRPSERDPASVVSAVWKAT